MAASLTLMLKTIVLLEKLTPKRLGVGDSEVNGFGVSSSVKHTKKLEKTFKSRNLAKFRKKVVKKWEFT